LLTSRVVPTTEPPGFVFDEERLIDIFFSDIPLGAGRYLGGTPGRVGNDQGDGFGGVNRSDGRKTPGASHENSYGNKHPSVLFLLHLVLFLFLEFLQGVEKSVRLG